eukprot:947349-Prorocentrum_minimum.AAC.1
MRCSERGYIQPPGLAPAGVMRRGARTNQMQDGWVYSHGGPMRRSERVRRNTPMCNETQYARLRRSVTTLVCNAGCAGCAGLRNQNDVRVCVIRMICNAGCA